MLGRRSKPKRVVRTPDDRMTLIEHLAELRTRIIKIALTLAVATTVVFFGSNRSSGGSPVHTKTSAI